MNRYETKTAIEAAGALCVGWVEQNTWCFAIGQDRQSVAKRIAELGLTIGRQCYFPLCSDLPPEEFRHDGRWLFWRVHGIPED